MSEEEKRQEPRRRKVAAERLRKLFQLHRPLFLACVVVVLLVGSTSKLMAQGSTQGEPTLPGKTCGTAPLEKWTAQEKWVWQQVCENKLADLTQKHPASKDAPDDWPEERVLRPELLETILLHKPYRSTVGRTGVRIKGAWFKEPIDLSNATLEHGLWLRNSRLREVNLVRAKIHRELVLIGSRFSGNLDMSAMEVGSSLFMRGGAEFKDANLRNAKVAGQVSMTGARFTGNLIMEDMEVGSSLFMRGGAEFKDVNLRNAKVAGQVSMIGARFTGNLDMNGMAIGSNLFMRGDAEFKDVNLRNAKVAGQVEMIGARFTGNLDMSAMEVGSSLLMRDDGEFKDVDLAAAKVKGQVVLIGSRFSGNLDMSAMEVGSSLLMGDGAEFGNSISLLFARVGLNLDLSDSKPRSIDLTGATIKGELRLGSARHAKPDWHDEAVLTLRNTSVGQIQDLRDAWPAKIELDGFTYSQLGGLAAKDRHNMALREREWLQGWLEKDSYSPQPYLQLATVLEKSGQPNKARAILYASKAREQANTPFGFDWLKLALERLFIGYGYRTYYAGYWIAGLVLVGWFWLVVSGQARKHKIGFWYTLDRLLPIIELDKSHYTISIEGSAKIYFYVHTMMGYLLATFIIAGLSGLTK